MPMPIHACGLLSGRRRAGKAAVTRNVEGAKTRELRLRQLCEESLIARLSSFRLQITCSATFLPREVAC
jgi:hypothetical protein